MKAIIIGILFFVSSCSGDLAVMTPQKPKAAILSLDKINAVAGDKIFVKGSNLTSRVFAKVGDAEPVPLTVESTSEGSFDMPTGVPNGLVQVTFLSGVTSVAKFPLFSGTDTSGGTPLEASQVCSDVIFHDGSGAALRGERQCTPCTEDGQSNCLATADVPATLKAGLAEKIVTGQTVAGVQGTVSQLTDCSADGATDCRATDLFPAIDKVSLEGNAASIKSGLELLGVSGTLDNCAEDGAGACIVDGTSYKAAKLANYSAADIRSGVSVAGVAGAMVNSSVPCSADGEIGCLSNANFPAVDKVNSLQANVSKIQSSVTIAGVAGMLDTCSSDGGTACVLVGTNYVAAATAGAAAKILTGQSLAGVAGTAAIKPADCSSDGQMNCVAVAAYPAVKKSTLTANTAKIRSSLNVAGVGGTLADCAADGEAGCVAVGPTYAAALLTGAPAKIANGQTLAGVVGTAALKPADCAADGDEGCVAVASFPAMDKATAAAKILTGQSIAGVNGTAPVKPADCASDGGTNCVAVANYPSVDKAALTTNAAKIRSSVSIASVSGTLVDCAADGESGCVALGPTYAAALLTGASAKIANGQTIAGVNGSAPLKPADCAADGGIGCVSVASFPAMDTSAAAAKILTGQSIAGVNGTAPVKPADCASDGGTNCVAVANYPAVDKVALTTNAAKIRSSLSIASVSGTLADCSADGGLGCVSIAAFPAMDTSTAAAKISTGQSIAGVAGTAAVRPADCSSDGGTNCVAVVNYPSVDKAALTTNAAKMRSSLSVASVSGTLGDCSADGDTNCVAVTSYPAVDKAALTANAAKIRSSLTIVSVNGTLADCSSDGDSGCVAVGPSYAAAVVSGAAAKILTGQSLAGVNGSAAVKPADCSADGATNCVAVTAFPAVDVTGAAPKIVLGQTLGGIAGSASGVRPSDCSLDAETNCVAVTAFPAMKVAGAAVKIALGDTLAGVAGTASVRPTDCAADGAMGCVAVTNYPAVDKSVLTTNAGKIRSSVTLASISGTLADCSNDGDTNCVAIATYPAALASGAASKILSGQTLAGVNGTAAIKPADCAADGSTNCVAVTNYPSVDKSALTANASKIRSSLTLASVSGTLADCSTDGGTSCVAVASYPSALASGAAAKILTGQTVAGVNGTASLRPADCAADGGTNCVAVANYPSVDKSALTANAGKIRSSVTLASVTGTLADCASDGDAGCVAIGPTYAAAVLSGAAAKILIGQTLAGVNGSAAIKPADCSSDGGTNCVAIAGFPAADTSGAAAKILTGQTLAGVNGSAAIKPADCSSDGGTNCVAVANYPSVDKAALTVDAGKVRSGTSFAGVSGSLADCAADGGTNCVAVTNYPSVDKAALTANAGKIHSSLTLASVAGTLNDCSADGDTSCMAVTAYPAALKAGAAAKILTGQTLAGVNGSAAIKPADCSSDGGTNCVAVAAYPAALASGAAAKILTGQTLAGVNGSAAIRPADCAADGDTSCVAVTAYPAALKAGAAAKILTGQTLAGVSGSAAIRPADCAADGDTSCVAVTAFPAALASGAAAKILSGQTLAGINGSAAIRPADCSGDNGTNCVAVTAYPSVVLANVTAGVVKNGTVIAGVTGAYPNATYPLPSASAAADLDSSTFNAKMKSATAFEWWDSTGNHYSGAGDANIVAGNIKNAVAVFGTTGTFGANCSSDGQTGCYTVTNYPAVDKTNLTNNAGKIRSGTSFASVSGTLSDCSSDNGTNCVAVTNYPSVVLANVTAGVVKSGTVIAGVTGQYPSATYTLPGAGATADLDNATFNAKVKSSTAFEYWDSSGTRQTGAGDTDITAASIKSGVDVFGTTGTYAPDCTGDGQTACATTSTYKSADTTAYNGWDIRSGKTIGGVAGNITFYKNMASLTTWNRTTGTGANSSTTVADYYDTLEDFNTGGAFPTTAPSGWNVPPGSAWLRDSLSDTGTGGGTASNGVCEGSEACVYKDQFTGLLWSKTDGTTRDWETAIAYCAGLNYGGYSSGWRLPTQKELYQAYVNAISAKASQLNLYSTNRYWTSTTYGQDTTQAHSMWLTIGAIGQTWKGDSYYAQCVRP